MVDIIEAHVLAAQRLHVDDTPVPVLAKGKTKTGRLWTAVRDDRPFGGTRSPQRPSTCTRPIVAACIPRRFCEPGPASCRLMPMPASTGCTSRGGCPGRSSRRDAGPTARRKFYEIAALKKAPIAVEAVTRIDAIFAIERTINGIDAIREQAVESKRSARSSTRSSIWLIAQRAHSLAEVRDREGHQTTA